MRAKQWQVEEENDWILLDDTDFEQDEQEEVIGKRQESNNRNNLNQEADQGKNLKYSNKGSYSFLFFNNSAKHKANKVDNNRKKIDITRRMTLEANEIELIRASWVPARKDTTSAGLLLFKGLFTKFPNYLNFFSQFSDLDLESLHENKKLIKHAVKVIDTVTFVVDSIGDDGKAQKLNDALVNLVRSHLKRRIGLKEFRNLGIVIIDFICDLQQRRGSPSRTQTNSPCENASLESKASSETDFQEESCARCQTYNHMHNNIAATGCNQTAGGPNSMFASNSDLSTSPPPSILDTNLLVAAWTKLYGSILDLVKQEGGEKEEDEQQH